MTNPRRQALQRTLQQAETSGDHQLAARLQVELDAIDHPRKDPP